VDQVSGWWFARFLPPRYYLLSSYFDECGHDSGRGHQQPYPGRRQVDRRGLRGTCVTALCQQTAFVGSETWTPDLFYLNVFEIYRIDKQLKAVDFPFAIDGYTETVVTCIYVSLFSAFLCCSFIAVSTRCFSLRLISTSIFLASLSSCL